MKRELLAQIVNPAVPSLKDPEKAPQILGKFVSGFISLLLMAATILAFVNLLLGAFNWISSGGDKGKLETAQQKILHAVMGLVLVFASWAIFIVLLQFLGMSDGLGGALKFILPTLL